MRERIRDRQPVAAGQASPLEGPLSQADERGRRDERARRRRSPLALDAITALRDASLEAKTRAQGLVGG